MEHNNISIYSHDDSVLLILWVILLKTR